MNIIRIREDYSYFGSGKAPNIFITAGCGCCAGEVRITEDSIQEAIQEAEEWLATLRALKPEIYPEED